MEATTTSVVTDRITPRRVRKERSLWVRRVSSAIRVGSRNEILRRGWEVGDIPLSGTACDSIVLLKDTIFCAVLKAAMAVAPATLTRLPKKPKITHIFKAASPPSLRPL